MIIKSIIFLLALAVMLGRNIPNVKNTDAIAAPSDDKGEKVVINNALWVTQFDLSRIFTDGGRQREKDSFASLADEMARNIKNGGFDTVFLQMHPNGDSMYESEYYPLSKYVVGRYGGALGYDAVGMLISSLLENSISVHAWINPYRLMTEREVMSVDTRFAVRKWYDSGNRNICSVGERLYVLPSSREGMDLLLGFVREMMTRYGFSGLHIDDYFYPTQSPDFDKYDFFDSEYTDLGDFRRHCTDTLVYMLYDTVKSIDPSLLFGVSPAGNVYSLYDGYYIDVNKWCAQEGYLDYICPQLYFGFKNKYCPFEKVFADWREVASDTRLIVGLSAAKALAGSKGELDVFAGTDEGKTEWINDRTVIDRQKALVSEYGCGTAVFCYSSLYG